MAIFHSLAGRSHIITFPGIVHVGCAGNALWIMIKVVATSAPQSYHILTLSAQPALVTTWSRRVAPTAPRQPLYQLATLLITHSQDVVYIS
jgi:hypothetical protein